MNEPVETTDAAPALPRPDETQACDLCGRFGAVTMGGRRLCVDCYGGCGSCCQESPLEN